MDPGHIPGRLVVHDLRAGHEHLRGEGGVAPASHGSDGLHAAHDQLHQAGASQLAGVEYQAGMRDREVLLNQQSSQVLADVAVVQAAQVTPVLSEPDHDQGGRTRDGDQGHHVELAGDVWEADGRVHDRVEVAFRQLVRARDEHGLVVVIAAREDDDEAGWCQGERNGEHVLPPVRQGGAGRNYQAAAVYPNIYYRSTLIVKYLTLWYNYFRKKIIRN